ncbi:TPA: hypothetical protein DIC40_04355 [Patescibacteria group bacterium]|nr:hypothetical protein [Candidatus Gracilibacteria bacterium]
MLGILSCFLEKWINHGKKRNKNKNPTNGNNLKKICNAKSYKSTHEEPFNKKVKSNKQKEPTYHCIYYQKTYIFSIRFFYADIIDMSKKIYHYIKKPFSIKQYI